MQTFHLVIPLNLLLEEPLLLRINFRPFLSLRHDFLFHLLSDNCVLPIGIKVPQGPIPEHQMSAYRICSIGAFRGDAGRKGISIPCKYRRSLPSSHQMLLD